ncbi:UDP-N-acetylmuramoylalanine--D-glutamate ligase [BD1-7 clade bacterium]|uniref:UDP-N-acetylmuramoylalanine--D-glutamate ligase n=1 Tax=BD1-7 clade bacterium TaxID=2029982 RepID=A0A5S9Q9J0_9GAMM|nr:UDP-N-acetylmuramoylalanine--D-glutamate ligase [BD1-7 clade bacterium]CAA0115270.1 UDP-N-acetylmuramoylalanine--D-glutamate ligase [BD1-7 clade bacterium]
MESTWGNRQVAIVGMGLTGLSCARFFNARRVPFRVVDSREQPPLLDQFVTEFPAVEFVCGPFNNDTFGADDVLVVSPGMPITEPSIVNALDNGALLTSDIELFINSIKRPYIAITGSNGKSTVTTLVGEMLKHSGIHSEVAGNIGRPVLEQLLEGNRPDIFVLELSSFQLERLPYMGAAAATILNVTEDHMDRYDSMEDYHAAKWRVFEGASVAVVNRDDATTFLPVSVLEQTPDQIIEYGLGPSARGFGIQDDQITYQGEPVLAADTLKIKGRHNQLNVMAAMALCLSLNLEKRVSLPHLADAAIAFKGLEHRCEYVEEINNVVFYNDSKATNVGAAVAAIEGLSGDTPSIILIAGGLDKNSDFTPLADVCQVHVKHTVLIGQDAEKIADALAGQSVSRAESLELAVAAALLQSADGDSVLFAPACASFDMFENYEARGDAFRHAVHGIRSQAGEA